jgi:uncharacterized membrane protein
VATVHHSIEVDVPVSTAYNQWTQFETFPEFMKGVEAVEQIDETSLQFRTDIAGVRREYLAQITEQTPDRKIAWVSTDKPRNAGTVTFEPLGAERARVNVELEWEPEGLVEKAGSAVGAGFGASVGAGAWVGAAAGCPAHPANSASNVTINIDFQSNCFMSLPPSCSVS